MGFVEAVTPDPAPAPARLSPREGRRPRDMAYSLLVLLVPIALLLTFYRVVLSGDAPITIDPTSAIEQAAKEFPVARPTGLGDDWHVSSAHTTRGNGGVTLRLGYVDPDGDPILFSQGTVPPATMVPAEVGKEGERTGAFRTDARTWMVYTGRPGETALVFTEASRTLVIVGSTERKNLETLARSLS